MPAFSSIALVKEIESPENPGGLEKRVALVPADVGRLTGCGIKVCVEYGAGEGVGFSDDEYLKNNATLQTAAEIYLDKELIIKFKGPSIPSIEQMRQGCTLLCMAHFHSYPRRAQLLQERRINVVAMEEILESPKHQSDEVITARMGMSAALQPFFDDNSIGGLRVRFLGWSQRMRGSIRRCGNRSPRSLVIVQEDVTFDQLDAVGHDTLYVYDSKEFSDPHGILNRLAAQGTPLFDLFEYEQRHGEQAVANYRATHPPAPFGMRRIQCLHETGRAGARYGMKLLRDNKPNKRVCDVNAIILGYGNVAQGALHELNNQGVHNIHVLGRAQTAKGRIDRWLRDVDLVVNGAEQAPQLRGVNFLITNQHLRDLIPDQSVVIDLVGGSQSNRSPVEPVINCSFLTAPAFVQDHVTVSSLWGWPMMGMMRETAVRYSGQIADVLVGQERLIDGLDALTPGVQRAVVCGPF